MKKAIVIFFVLAGFKVSATRLEKLSQANITNELISNRHYISNQEVRDYRSIRIDRPASIPAKIINPEYYIKVKVNLGESFSHNVNITTLSPK